MEIPVLIVTGTVGVGKSTVAYEMHSLLCDTAIPHALVDMDELSMSYPPKGDHNRGMGFDGLAAVWPRFREAGANRLLIVDVIESRDYLGGFERAVPDSRITICRLTAPQVVREERITARNYGASRDWHLHRTGELEAILELADVADFTVTNDGRSPLDTARDVLTRAGWL